MKDTKLYKTIVSKENLYKAIYALESYISERNLLKSEDLERNYVINSILKIYQILSQRV